MVSTVLLVISLLCFAVATFSVQTGKLNLVAAGLAFLALSMLL